MKKIIKVFGVILLVFAIIVVFVIVKDVIDNNKTNTPPITDNGGNSGNNNNGNNTGDDPNKKPEEPEKEVYTTYEPADELVRKINVIEVDSVCLEGKQDGKEYCIDTPIGIYICWFGGGNATKEAMVENLKMITSHPEFEKLNKNKKISIAIDITYVNALHGNITYEFGFFVGGHSGETNAIVRFTGRIAASKESVMIKQEDIDSVYNLYKTYNS